MAYLDSVDILGVSMAAPRFGWIDIMLDFGRDAAAALSDLCRLC